MTQAPLTSPIRKTKGPFTVIIARGDHIRHFAIRPWLMGVSAAVAIVAMATSFTAAGYAVFRDDLMSAALSRQVRLQQTYEDRIAVLRAQIDRITSQQALDQELMRRKVGELIKRQQQLAQRQSQLSPVLGYSSETSDGEPTPAPAPRPTLHPPSPMGTDPIITGSAESVLFPLTAPKSTRGLPDETPTERANRFFVSMSDTLRDIEQQQIKSIEALAEETYQASEALAGALKTVGINIDMGEENTGGPFIPLPDNMPFEEKVQELDAALATLGELTKTARRMPLASPVSEGTVTSHFGMRRDPILGRRAFHSGVDFRANLGASIRASGPGTVVKTGWAGGYGRMVEVDHGNGLTSRYAHLSKILVKRGEEVGTDTIIGHAGSSGRSTGPHLHYEVRRNDQATNPMKFIEAGRRVKEYL